MRLKTFISTYLLFICVLFSSISIISVYMTNSQIKILKENSISQFQTIANSFTKDLEFLWGRNDGIDATFYDAVDALIRAYARYYDRQNINISITNLKLSAHGREIEEPELSVINTEQNQFINIIGSLPPPFNHYVLEYGSNITGNISDMKDIQNVLLLATVVFSVVAAFVLHFILASIFKPLAVVAEVSKKIADGGFDERIHVTGKNELARVAIDFNKMAQTIENQIAYLEEEALNKQQFVDNFAHEIRTPLTSIYGYAQYIQKARLSETEIIESMEYIMTESDRMNNIANSLLELATLRDFIPAKKEIVMAELFSDISKVLENILRANETEFEFYSNDTVIQGQEDLIRSLLLNLCNNSIKACEKGKGKIWLEAANHDGYVSISLTDNGCGIPEESISKVCEPFYRVDKSRSREHGGAGLGLTLCNQIAQVHNAKMFVESVEGKGTIIKINFTTS